MLGVTELQQKVVDSAHNIWLAGLGAATLAQEDGSKLFESLVQKGQEVEKTGGSPVMKVRDGLKETLKDAADRATATWEMLSGKVDEQVTASLHRMGLPTREEIATLTRRVDALIVSVDKLRAKSSAHTDPPTELGNESMVVKA